MKIRNILFFISAIVLFLTPCAFAQVPITGVVPVTSDTTRYVFAAGEQTLAASVDYLIDDGATLTVSSTGRSTLSGALFNVNTAGASVHFTATASGADGTGLFLMDGTGARNSLSTTGAAGVAYMGAGNSYFTIISGTRDGGDGTVVTGTIRDLWAGSHGGAFYIKTGTNTLTLQNIHFVNNGAIRANSIYGGAISAENTGIQNISLNNVTFTSNQIISSRTNNNGSAYGGAISASSAGSAGAWSMTDVTFDCNIALGETTSSGASHTALGYGGAIYQLNGSRNETFRNIVFTNNMAKALGNQSSATAQGGALYLSASQMDYEDVRFEGNLAIATTVGGPGIAYGGAVYMAGATSQLQFTNVLFASNTATATGASITALGGAIYQAAGLSTITSGTFTGNHADTGGGALYIAGGTASLTNVLITGNTAAAGGALQLASGEINIALDSTASDTIYAGNTAADADSGGFAYLAGGTLALNIAGGKTLTIGSAANTDADTIVGVAAAAITVNAVTTNTGALILHGNSAANVASVSIGAGSLLLGNANAALGGAISVAGGATFGGSGSAAGSVTLSDNAALRVGYGRTAAQTLDITGALTLTQGTLLSYGIYDTDVSDLLNVGSLTRTGTTTIDLNQMLAGTYTLISSAANLLVTDTDNLITTINGVEVGGRQTATYSILNNTDLLLTLATSNVALLWTGTTSNIWSTAAANWTNGDDYFVNGDGATFTTTGGTAIEVVGSVTAAELNINNTTGTLTFDGAGSINTNAAGSSLASPTGKLTKQGAGSLVLANTGTNLFDAGIALNEGSITGNADTLRVGSSAAITLAASTTLAFDQVVDGVYANTITGDAASTLQKLGAGSLTLTADNSAHLGATKISAGALVVNGQLGGAVIVESTLAGTGTLLGSVTASEGSIISVGLAHGVPNATGTLTIDGTLSLANNTTVRLDIDDGSAGDLLSVGELARTGTSTIDLSTAQSGTYKIISVTDSTLAATATSNLLTTNNGGNLTSRTQASYEIIADDLWLTVITGNAANSKWSGSNTGVWAEGLDNWTTDDQRYIAGDSVIFDDTAAGTHDILVNAGAVTVADMIVNTSGSYSFTGDSAITTSTVGTTLVGTSGKLTINGSGLVVLANNAVNNFTGGIALNSGTLQGNADTLNASGIANAATLVFNQESNATYAASITGAGSLVKINTGTLTLDNAANTYAGGIAVRAGALELQNSGITTQGVIDISADAALRITNGASYTIQHALTGAGTLFISLDAPTSAVNFTTASAFAGTVQLGQSIFDLSGQNTAALANATLNLGAGNITTIGAGTQAIGNLVLDGGKLVFTTTVPSDTAAAGMISTNTVALNSGTIQVSIPAAITNPTTGANLLAQDDGSTVVTLVNATTATLDSSVVLVDQTGETIGAATEKTVGITQAGSTVATATYNYGLSTTSDAGEGLHLNYKLTSLTIADDATLNLAPDIGATGASTVFSATISGSGNLSINAANAPVTLDAANNFTGTTMLTSGTLIIGVDNALGGATNALVLSANTTLNLGSSEQTLATITDTASSTIDVSSGTLNLSGGTIRGALAGTTGGVLNLTDGALTLLGTGENFNAALNVETRANVAIYSLAALGTGTINLAANSGLWLRPSADSTFATTITGEGRLDINGAGVTTIASDNSDFTGPTAINANAIAAHAAAFGPSGEVTISDTAALTYEAIGMVTNSIRGTGTLNIGSTGDITLAALNTIPSINVLENGRLTATRAGSLGGTATRIGVHGGSLVLARDGLSAGEVTMTGASRLVVDLPTGSVSLKSLTSTGTDATLVFNTNMSARTVGRLTVADPITGAYGIELVNTGSAPRNNNFSMTLISNANSAAAYYIKTDTIGFDDSPELFLITQNTTIANTVAIDVRNAQMLSDAGKAMVANAGGSMPLTWFAELETVEKRMGDLRLGGQRTDGGFDIWARGYARRLDVNGKPTGAAFSEDQYGAEAGIDYCGVRKDGAAIYIGAFAGYGKTSRDMDDVTGDGDTNSVHGGLYFTALTRTGWYVDLVGKYNSFENEYSVTTETSQVRAEYDLDAIGGSLALGKFIRMEGKWFIQPSAQIAFTRIEDADYVTSAGMQVGLESTNTLQVSAGMLAGYTITTKSGGVFQPYAKAYGAQQWTRGGDVAVDDKRYSATVDGSRLDIGIGFNWMPARRVQFYFDYEFAKAADYTKPYGLTVGVRYQW